MPTTQLLKTFYTAFSNGDATTMASCYSDDVVFEDPAFGSLKGDRAKAMWHMLLSRDSKPEITFEIIEASEHSGKVKWTAKYNYGKNQRPVVNHVVGTFRIENHKIVEHKDSFSLWKWSRQALGVSGYLMGWSGFMKKKIQKTTNGLLAKYVSANQL